MTLRYFSVFIACFFCIATSAFETRQIPSYLLRKPEVYNPFKGMFQNWENRKTVRESANERVNTYIRELIQFYPESNPEDIQLFMKWYYFGSKNLNITKPSPRVSPDNWGEAARIVKLFYARKNSEARNALRQLLRKLPSGDLLRYELIKLERDSRREINAHPARKR